MDKLKISRLALALAILCVIVNVINFFVPFNTYGVDNFLLAALMGVLAFNFKMTSACAATGCCAWLWRC